MLVSNKQSSKTPDEKRPAASLQMALPLLLPLMSYVFNVILNGNLFTLVHTQNDLFPDPPSDGDLTWDIQDDPIDEDLPDGVHPHEAFGLIAMDVRRNYICLILFISYCFVGPTGITLFRARFIRLGHSWVHAVRRSSASDRFLWQRRK